MTVLLSQIWVEKVRIFPLTLCERALDSDEPATLVFYLVGTIKDFDEDVVGGFLFYWSCLLC